MLRRTCRLTVAATVFAVCWGAGQSTQAQFAKKWLSAGSYHNWYSEIGSEIESGGFVGNQQDGARFPGIYRYSDTQAWKGLWIGARNFTDETGDWPYRVVHAGPRVSGSGEFFPVNFEMVSKHPPTDVFVDGFLSESLAPMANDRIDPDIPSDRMIVTVVNTLLGLTMERRVMQFSQQFHDNYHVVEYILTNTGNTDGDADIELPDETLEDVYFFNQWRWSVARETRYVIGNATGWGINTMVDTWGDGEDENLPSPGEPVRAQYAWHGFYPDRDVSYNNIGGPVLPEAQPVAEYISSTDTLGRLAAYQFVGAVTLHADTSPTDPTDDVDQPATTTWISSDAGFQSNNDAFHPAKMEEEYDIMSSGHKLPAHAYAVEPSGLAGWIDPSGTPAQGTPGGFSAATGYGPYTLAPGESVRIVVAEGVSGLSREAANAIGRAYNLAEADDDALIAYEVDGTVHEMTKNEWTLTGRDSLYQTFLRAIANYESGYEIPESPAPPSALNVESGGDRISLAWEYPADAALPEGFEIYRAANAYDSTYTLIHETGPGEMSYDDTTPIRGIDYYYYVVAVTSPNSDGTGLTPTGVRLRSSRYATQTYVPANLKRPAGEALSDIRIVPNPFNLGSSPNVRWPDQTDKLGFLNVPGRARIEIYTELGELVDTIEHDDGSGDTFWDHTTSSRQLVASGIYFAVITDVETGGRVIKKFAIIR